MRGKLMSEIKRVYVAGKLTDQSSNYIHHMHNMIIYGLAIESYGFSAYVPCRDLLSGLVSSVQLKYEDYFDRNIVWLDVSDALFVCPNYKTSEGTKREILRAYRNHIPIFDSISQLRRWGAGQSYLTMNPVTIDEIVKDYSLKEEIEAINKMSAGEGFMDE